MSRVIFIEGVDGSGKTTLINKLKEKYKTANVEFLTPFSFEEGGKEKLLSIAESSDLKKEITYLADVHKRFKAMLNERLENQIETFFIVDRSIMSFLAYQLLDYKYAMERKKSFDNPKEIEILLSQVSYFPFEASFIYLDVKKDILLNRVEERKEKDILDKRLMFGYDSLLRLYRESFFYLTSSDKHLYKKPNNTLDDMYKIIEFVDQKIESQRPIKNITKVKGGKKERRS